MVVAEVYLDESHTDDGKPPIFVVGGYLIKSDQARLMERDWRDVLDRYGMPYFHMVDVAHGNEDPATLSEGQRIAFQTEIIELIKKYTLYGVVAVVNEETRKKAVHPYPSMQDSYSMCLGSCVAMMCSAARQSDLGIPPGEVAFFFEDGHETKKEANRLLTPAFNNPSRWLLKDVFHNHTFGTKKKFVLLQAADVLAWQAVKFLKDKINKTRKPRGDFVSLMEKPTMFLFDVLEGDRRIAFNNDWRNILQPNPGLEAAIKSMFQGGRFSIPPETSITFRGTPASNPNVTVIYRVGKI